MNIDSGRLRRLLEPLNLSAYLTWLAVLLALLDTPAEQLQDQRRGIALASMLGFLAAFLAKDWTADRRHTWHTPLLLGAQAFCAIALCVVWHGSAAAPVLTVVLMAQCAETLTPRGLTITAVALNLALWSIFEFVWQMHSPWAMLLIYAGFQAFAALTMWYARRARETATALRETNAHLLATRELLEESARDQERLRLARELHDVAGHKLTALKLNLALLQRESPVELRPTVDLAARLAGEVLDDARGVVAQLRQHDGMNLRHALTELAAPLPHPRVLLDIADDARVANVAQAEALLRSAQEALTNIARHAGADNAWIVLRRRDDTIHLQVHDDGRGSLPLREGNGLRGMRERLAALGGSLTLSDVSGGGILLDIQLPLTA